MIIITSRFYISLRLGLPSLTHALLFPILKLSSAADDAIETEERARDEM